MADDAVTCVVDAPAVFKASVWSKFGFAGEKNDGRITTDRKFVVCKICNSEMKYSGNTTNLHTHLLRHHPDIAGTLDIPNVSAKSSTSGKRAGIVQSSLITSFSTRNKKLDASKTTQVTDAIAKFIIKDLRPYSVVENEGFVHLIKTLEPRYKMPSRQHIAEKIVPALYEDVKSSLVNLIHDASFVGLTTDGWTSRANESFVTFTAHFLDKNWQLQNSVLQTRTMTESHTGQNLAHLLLNVLEEWHISPDKVAAVTTDNAANMVVMVREAELTHLKCFAHTLNLASQKALKVATVIRVLAIIRRTVSYFHRSPKAFAVLKEKQVLLNLPSHKLKNDVPTRWNSSYEMVDRYLEQQPAIHATLLTKELRKSGDTHLPASLGDGDMTIAEDIVQIMKPMKTATTVMCDEQQPSSIIQRFCSDKSTLQALENITRACVDSSERKRWIIEDEQQPTLSVVFPLYSSLLKSLTPHETDSRTAKDMKKAMHDDLSRRYQNDVDVSLLRCAAALDPRFKDLPFLNDVERMGVFSNIAVEVSQLKDEVSVKQEPDDTPGLPDLPALPLLPDVDPEDPPRPEAAHQSESDSNTSPPRAKVIKLEAGDPGSSKCALDDLLGEVFITGQDEAPTRSKLDVINEEISMFRKSPSIQLSSSAMKWWQENNIFYPNLAKIARKYLCIPGTSVPSERVFSTSGDIVTAQRASLKAAHVDKLVFLKKNLRIADS